MAIQPFKPELFSLLDSREWWHMIGPESRLVFLKMLDLACSSPASGVPGVVSASPVMVRRMALGAAGNLAENAERIHAKGEVDSLVKHGAIYSLESPTTRHVYGINEFDLFASALDTHRALSRRWAKKRRESIKKGDAASGAVA